MYCYKCGTELQEESRFCNKCGTAVDGEKKKAVVKERFQKIIETTPQSTWAVSAFCLVLAIVLLAVIVNGTGGQAKKGDIGFDSPETAMEYFVKEISNQNLDGAIRAFAVETRAKKFDLETQLKEQEYTHGSTTLRFSSSSDFGRELNEASLRNRAVNNVLSFCYYLSIDEKYISDKGGSAISFKKNREISDFVKAVEMDSLSTLKLLRMDQKLYDDYLEEVYSQDQKFTNSDDQRHYYVLYECGGDTFGGLMKFVKYDDSWYILNMDVFGNQLFDYVERISERDYKKLIKD